MVCTCFLMECEKKACDKKKKKERCIFECAITHTGVSMHVCNPHTPPFYFSFLFLIKKTSLIRILPVVHIVKASGANYEWPASLLYHPISTPELLITLLLCVSLQPHFRTIRSSTPLVSIVDSSAKHIIRYKIYQAGI